MVTRMCERRVTHGPAVAKQALRERLRAQRRTTARSVADGRRLAAAVLALPEVLAACSHAGAVAAYVSRPGEPPTGELIERLLRAGVDVLLPVLLPDLDLDWALDDGTRQPGFIASTLEPGGERGGVDAIARAEVIVVPALAVDQAGRRLGQGGGSYDRALTRADQTALVVALVHDSELLDEPVPVAAHDRWVDAAVTTARTVRF